MLQIGLNLQDVSIVYGITPLVTFLASPLSGNYTRQKSFLQYLNSDFLFYLGWSGSVSTKQAKYNEGCSKLNYLLAEV